MKNLSLTFCLGIATLLASVGNGFALPKCTGSYSSATWTNCKGTYYFPSGNKYVGEYKDGKRNGKGTFTWTNGDKYVGDWKYDNFNGQGIYYNRNLR